MKDYRVILASVGSCMLAGCLTGGEVTNSVGIPEVESLRLVNDTLIISGKSLQGAKSVSVTGRSVNTKLTILSQSETTVLAQASKPTGLILDGIYNLAVKNANAAANVPFTFAGGIIQGAIGVGTLLSGSQLQVQYPGAGSYFGGGVGYALSAYSPNYGVNVQVANSSATGVQIGNYRGGSQGWALNVVNGDNTGAPPVSGFHTNTIFPSNSFTVTWGGDVHAAGMLNSGEGLSYAIQPGQSGLHLYNNGQIAEWEIGQPSVTRHDLVFRSLVAGTYSDKMVLRPNGYVGIGTTAPLSILHVQSPASGTYLTPDGLYGLGVYSPSFGANIQVTNAGGKGLEINNYSAGTTTSAINVTNGTGTCSLTGTPLCPSNFSVNWSGKVRAAGMFNSGNGPDYTLQTGQSGLHMYNGGSIDWELGQSSSSNSDLRVRTLANGLYSDKMIVLTNGNVGIGTTNPVSLLQVQASPSPTGETYFTPDGSYAFGTNATLFGANIQVSRATGRGLQLDNYPGTTDATAYAINVTNGNTGCTGGRPCVRTFSVAWTGAVTALSLTQTSDLRFKKDILPLEDSLEKILSLKGVSYYWKDQSREPDKQIGFIAQEVERFFPELVRSDGDGFKSLNYSGLIAPAIEAIKSIYEKITAHEATTQSEISALKEENVRLKLRLERLEKKIQNLR